MNLKTSLLLVAGAMLWLSASAVPTESAAEIITCPALSADLANVLAEIAWRAHLPMVAELAQPLPTVEVAAGTYVVRDLLQGIARQAPGYQWVMEGSVVYFVDTSLKEAKFNFLHMKLSRFIVPPNVSELKLTFPTLEYGLLQGATSTGYFITGFGDALLEKETLATVTIENITGSEALFYVANESPTFFTIIVYPNDNPSMEQMEADMNRNWFWQSLKEKQPETLYIKPPRPRQRARSEP